MKHIYRRTAGDSVPKVPPNFSVQNSNLATNAK
jgi:hypothetical protein